MRIVAYETPRLAIRDSARETLANLSVAGHLRCFSDQPVAEIIQCGEAISRLSVLSGEVTLHSERMGKVNSIRRRNTICDRTRYGCALVEDVVE